MDSTTAYADSAFARPGPVNHSWMRLKLCGTATAAPAPWANLNATRAGPSGAIAHASDAAVNSAIPARYIRLRPWMSPSRAPVISSMA